MTQRLIVLFCFLVSTLTTSEGQSTVRSLCDKPTVNAADRMSNNTVRIYRDNHYWVLNGMPSDKGSLEGPFPITYKSMAPILLRHTVVSLLGGTDRGKVVKTEDKNYWMWDERGELKTAVKGVFHNRFPSGGFDAAIHDGNPDDPTLIGFKGIRTYYLSTRYKVWTIDGKPSGHIGGKYKENFPTDVNAAFTLQDPADPSGYIVYFFQKDKYCKRTKILKSGKQCDEWLPSRQLFGCNTQLYETADAADSSTDDVNIPEADSANGNQTAVTTTSKPKSDSVQVMPQIGVLVALSIGLNLIFDSIN